MDQMPKAIQKGLEQGAILGGNALTDVQLIKVPLAPEGVRPNDWVAWCCYMDVQRAMIDGGRMSAPKACEASGWSYNTWRAASRNQFALGMWAEVMGEARGALATYLRENLLQIGQTLVERATNKMDPQGVQASKVILAELKSYQEEVVEAAGGSAGPVMSSAALLQLSDRAKKTTLRRKNRRKGTVDEIEIEHDDK